MGEPDQTSTDPRGNLPERSPLSGISILIVGAGVGGLLAALECWRKGHEVQIIEKSSTRLITGMQSSHIVPNSFSA